MAQSTPFHFHWAISALLALLLIGSGQYIVAMNSQNPWAGMFMFALGFLVFAIAGTVAFKLCGAWAETGMLCDNEGRLRSGVFTVSWSASLIFIGEASLILGFYFDPEGVGITASIISGSAILSALLAFVFYQESLNANQIIGILATTFGLVLITWESAQDGTYLAVISAFAALVCFSTKN
jgi:drug/metabolite transporter (DMT)-like permease